MEQPRKPPSIVHKEGSHMEKKDNIIFNSVALDDAIEKANRLVELLREAQQIVDSLSGKDIEYLRKLASKKCESTF